MEGKVWQQEREVAGHIVTVRKQGWSHGVTIRKQRKHAFSSVEEPSPWHVAVLIQGGSSHSPHVKVEHHCVGQCPGGGSTAGR